MNLISQTQNTAQLSLSLSSHQSLSRFSSGPINLARDRLSLIARSTDRLTLSSHQSTSGMEYKHEIGEEEARTILEVIA
ncbi:unnamed protein product [Camellia sinensis]